MKYKAHPYRHQMHGMPQPGKVHSLRDGKKTTCGLTIAKVPGLISMKTTLGKLTAKSVVASP